MKLKTYQEDVLGDLEKYLDCVDEKKNIISGWETYWNNKDISVGTDGVPAYHNNFPGTPHVCFKVPTGGGKTFLACSSIKTIFDHMPQDKPQVVIWLVPSEAILTQTIENLSNPKHFYREKLDNDFSGRVGIYTKEMLLSGQNFSPDTIREMLTVCVFSYASLRINSSNRDTRKVYQENGNLLNFAHYFKDNELLLADTPDTALIQVLRQVSPVVVVDESHNAGSVLSNEMIQNLNPSFVLELTATPKSSSNIISYVDARKLKSEHMVKLPVIFFNKKTRQEVIRDAIQLRGSIEKETIKEYSVSGKYIRPIVLFQAEPKTDDDKDTFDKVKNLLLNMGIPEEQIAIKTSKINDLKNIDLMSDKCEIRYIITVNALKEGWDCPFAYILASLANKSSKIDVEQILGRVLRQPHTKEYASTLLNSSYVFACSENFKDTISSIIKGLNNSGFSRKDYRAPVEEVENEDHANEEHGFEENTEQTSFMVQEPAPSYGNSESVDMFSDINAEDIAASIQNSGAVDSQVISDMLATINTEAEDYNNEIVSTQDSPFIGGELGDMITQNVIREQFREEIKELKIPQFFVKGMGQTTLFGGEDTLLEPENLSEGFSLNGLDANINFNLNTGEIYNIDLRDEGEAIPQYISFNKTDSDRIRKYFDQLAPEHKRTQSINRLAKCLNRNNRYSMSEIEGYVQRVVSNLSEDELETLNLSAPSYAEKIGDKITELEKVYRHEKFITWLDSGKVLCKESYKMPELITPMSTIDSIPYSLYEAEKDDMNPFEVKVIDSIVSTGKVRWWHRIIEKNDFCINGFIKHYPDFMIRTTSGMILLVEAKGDHLDNSNSKLKLALGRKWQEKAGNNYRYFMVFNGEGLDMDGSYSLDNFISMMKDM
ncbi:DEAD/DEAH box helicase [Butyrivibrio sp. XPD2006]|uniref:DEAD/DEAH box helicase n=1 Tax=Butyrivibrio sp. XPD2006 TaxID=1280668 RepID=UPI0003B78967|nr:DEAD/DEAH box helicase family protein [Butyrivibrio sp. XPD2006]